MASHTAPMRLRRRLGTAALVVALGLPVPGTGSALLERLPDLGDVANTVMTPSEERQLGDAFMRQIRRSEVLLEDPLVQDYLDDLGQQLASTSAASGQGLRFFIVDNPQINAFAGPAGHIGVFTGLILTTETENELAAVVAHEIAHVTQRHLLRTWHSASEMAAPQAALLLAAIALGVAAGGDAGIAAAAASQAGFVQQQINYTRQNEREADRVGITILAEAGFEPRAMPSFFARMNQANRVYASSLPELLRTHPVTNERIADSLGRADAYPPKQRPDDLRFQLVRAHLREREHSDPLDAVAMFARNLEDGRHRLRAAELYGLARAQLRAGQHASAHATLDNLQAETPDIVEFIALRAALQRDSGDTAAALATLEQGLTRHPFNYPLRILRAEWLLDAGQTTEAASVLSDLATLHPGERRLHQLLGRAAGELGKPVLGYEHLAEFHYLSGDLKTASLQLDIALRDHALSFYDRSRLEARREAIEAELEAQEGD